jgi:CRISPR system Cascade subunit CasE
MTTPHLIRIALDPRALTAFAIAEHVDDDDSGYAAHLALRRRYGPAAPQPFLLRVRGPGDPHIIGYAADPGALAEAATLPPADDRLARIFPDPPASRAMPDTWRAGARYGFEVRVRPLVRFGGRIREARSSREDAWCRRAGEIDAFLAACEKANGGPVNREAVYRDWLVTRTQGAAEITDAVMVRHQRLRTRRSSHGRPGRATAEASEAVFRGTLCVVDPVAFARLLARGVGRHTAFGFGMLLLSPPGRI